MGTKDNPPPFDCYNNALPHEEMFTVLSRDITSAEVVRFWCLRRVALGLNKWGDPQITEAMECAARMEQQRATIRQELGKPV
jgi:hypothetical protein